MYNVHTAICIVLQGDYHDGAGTTRLFAALAAEMPRLVSRYFIRKRVNIRLAAGTAEMTRLISYSKPRRVNVPLAALALVVGDGNVNVLQHDNKHECINVRQIY